MTKTSVSLGTDLVKKIDDREFTVGVIGLGYVGLPLMLAFSRTGLKVLGFDLDPEKPESLIAGKSYFRHLPDSAVAEMVATGRFDATTDFSRLAEADALLICVPTPLAHDRTPDVSYVINTGEKIAEYLRPGQLVVLESTTYPGCTREVLLPILEKSGLKCGEDFLLAYSPEREDPGNQSFETSTIPKVVAGHDEAALAVSKALYVTAIPEVVEVSGLDTGEAVKITENVFRAVNIALVNELKLIYERLGIDVWEVVDAAKTKPFGYMPFYPGPGLGGHCIPIDPFYLTWKARQTETATRFIELAGEINVSMPHHVVSRMQDGLNDHFGKAVRGAKVLAVGIAYKKNIDDIRESPALSIIELVEAKGAVCDFHDPYVPEVPQTREHGELAGRKSVDLCPDTLAEYDALIICTDHDVINRKQLIDYDGLIVDSRNAMKGMSGRAVVIKA